MDNRTDLPEGWAEYLESLEAELGVPITVIDGAYGSSPVDRHTPDGVTLVVNGRAGGARQWGVIENWPAELRATRRAALARPALRDTVAWQHGREDSVEPLTFGADFGEIVPGVVYYAWRFLNATAAELEAIDLDVLFRQQIELALDPEFEQLREVRLREAGAKRYAEFVQRSPQTLLEDVRRRVAAHETDAADDLQRHTSALTQLRSLRREADAIMAAMERSPDDWSRDWDALSDHDCVSSLGFENDKLVIVTTPIRMHHPDTDESRWLGRFRIKIGVGNVEYESQIEFENLDNPHNGRPHPHVTNDGVACFGGIAATVAKYQAEAAIIPLFETLIHYLESFNPEDDYGLNASWWFDLPDAEPQEAVTA